MAVCSVCCDGRLLSLIEADEDPGPDAYDAPAGAQAEPAAGPPVESPDAAMATGGGGDGAGTGVGAQDEPGDANVAWSSHQLAACTAHLRALAGY